jgi:AbrB family looped-hinge helix DNA binding protein
MKATVTSKGQITIPAPIREKLGLTAGTVLEFDNNSSHLSANKTVDVVRMRSVIGILKKPLAQKSTLQWLEKLRGPVDLPPKRK